MGLKDVRVLAYVRRGPDVELMREQVTCASSRPLCGHGPWSKNSEIADRPTPEPDAPRTGALSALRRTSRPGRLQTDLVCEDGVSSRR